MLHTKDMLIWSCSLCGLFAAGSTAEQILFDFSQDFDISTIEARDTKVSLSTGEGGALRVATGHSVQWPGIDLKSPEGRWDLSARQYIALDIENAGTDQIAVFCRVDNPGADGVKNCLTGRIDLKPGEKKRLGCFSKGSYPMLSVLNSLA